MTAIQEPKWTVQEKIEIVAIRQAIEDWNKYNGKELSELDINPEQFDFSQSIELQWKSLACLTYPDIAEDEIDDYADEARSEALSEIRGGAVETNIPAPCSRHYESKSVAVQWDENTWIGWTYWYGGGKHGEPESIEWMNDAYELCVVAEKTVLVREFEKIAE